MKTEILMHTTSDWMILQITLHKPVYLYITLVSKVLQKYII